MVAAVHGLTIGAGFEWALNADVTVAAASSRFKLPEASLGVFLTGVLSATLPAYVGVARAKALMLLGEEFSPIEAQAWGVVWRVYPDDLLDAESRHLAAKLAALRPDVAARFKRVLNELGLSSFEHAINLENLTQRALGGAEAS